MNLGRARQLAATLPDKLRDEFLDCLTPNDDLHAHAHAMRVQLQSRGYKFEAAVQAAVRAFESKVTNVDGLEKAIRNPNGRIRKKSQTIESDSNRLPETEL